MVNVEQPPDVPEGPAPRQEGQREGPVDPAPRKGKALLVLAIIVGFVAAVAGVAGFVVYDRATAIDRSTPTVVVRQFLQAALIDQDVAKVALYVCGEWAPADALNRASPTADPSVTVSWGTTSEQVTGNEAQVTTKVTFSITGSGLAHRDVETWRFEVVRESGWRVCGLQRQSSLDPE